MIIGYARVSTHDQNLDSQLDALQKADCEQIFQEKITGKTKDRPELISCLKALRKGDVLVVWKLDRLARSLKDLVEIITDLNQREIGFKSLTEAIDTTCHLQTTMRHSKQPCDLENGSDNILREKQFCTVVLSFPI